MCEMDQREVTSLTGHFGGLGSLVHRTVHVVSVRTSALVVGSVGSGPALVSVRPAAVAFKGSHTGSGCCAGTDQTGHAGRGHVTHSLNEVLESLR